MTEPQQVVGPREAGSAEPEYVEFWPAGAIAVGRFRCTACGNAVKVRQVLPRCMLCGEGLWEREESSPYVDL